MIKLVGFVGYGCGVWEKERKWRGFKDFGLNSWKDGVVINVDGESIGGVGEGVLEVKFVDS